MSSLIKAGSQRMAAAGLAGVSLRDIHREAESYLAEARARADEIIAEAVADAERNKSAIHEQSRRQGFAEGMETGRREGHEAALADARKRFAEDQKKLVSMMVELISQFVEKRERFFAQSRQDVVLLGVAIARRLCERLTASDEFAAEISRQAVEEALACVRSATDVAIRVHPEDASLMDAFVDTRSQRGVDGRHVRVVEDAAIDRGGVIVETADTTVDANVTSRIDQIASELAARWRERTEELNLGS
ncbi:MAG TPA: FliH/SctL family protein [Phycisphaerae bacterium]|nr:FliH/SctL family protein [Phycisphaerae bacterium]HRW51564.1 FliH/SctL family protein [Phycisphaerae bacterium]